MKVRRLLGPICAVLLLASGARASAPVQPPESVARANAGTVGVISGGVDGTYVRIAADLSSVLDDGDTLRVLPVLGKGSLQNLADIIYLRGIDIGIVQSDALTYAKSHNLDPGISQSVQYIAKLYDEEVHVLGGKEITNLGDLAGKKVNIDVRGSGTGMTASILFDSIGVAPEFTNFDQNTALEKLKRGEIAALVYVAGKPARLFSGSDIDSGLHFIPVPLNPRLLEIYLPATLDHADYAALVPEGAPVETIAVGSVMAVYAWQPGTERYRKVARFVDAFFGKFQQFLQPPHHPKWRDVNLAAEVPGWTRFGPAQDWLRQQAVAEAGRGTTQAQFNAFLTRVGGTVAKLPDRQKDALFQQFQDWQARQHRTTVMR
jgi:uncharacterized protein